MRMLENEMVVFVVVVVEVKVLLAFLPETGVFG